MNPNRRTQRARSTAGSRTVFLAALAGIVIVGLAIVAFVVGGNGDDDDDGGNAATIEETASRVTVDGTALAPYGGEPDPASGEPFPTLTGTGVDGEDLVISGDDGPMVIVYLAHWCPHCQREVPVLVDYVAAGRLPEGVRMVAVSTGIDERRDNYPPSAWLEREQWQQPTLVDPDSAAAAAGGLPAFPYFVAVDGDGNVTARTTGELTEDQLDALIATTNPPS